MQTWKRFIQTQYGNFVKEFFKKLNHEISGANVQSDNANNKNAVLILNTKKGYWLYKLFEREEHGLIDPIEVYSDRYMKKNTNFSFLENKLIYLVDDTLAHGYNLLETYKQLADFLDTKYICPLVFALRDTVDIEKMKTAEGLDEVEAQFWRDLKFFIKMSEGEMGEFCAQETKLLHDEGIPYVIDLPYLKMESKQQSEMDFEVVMSQEQFKLLQEGNKLWKFDFNSCIIYQQEFLRGFTIQMRDDDLLNATDHYILNYVIEGTYRINEQGDVCIVFVPFAIGKSISVENLKQLWHALIGNEAASEEALVPENLLKRYYRECIYVLSIVVAEKFSKYLESLTDIKLVYDYHILEDHFSAKFIEFAKQLESTYKAAPDAFYEKLLQKLNGNRIKNREWSEDDSIKTPMAIKKSSEAEAYEIVATQVLEQSKQYQLRTKDKTSIMRAQDAAVKFEDIQTSLVQIFMPLSKQEQREILSKIIVTLVHTSIAGGRLYLSKNTVHKAFRYGENSDLALPFFNLEFYWAVILLMEKKNRRKDLVLEIYDSFVKDLQRKFSESGLFEKDFTEKRFNKNRDYYKDVLQNDLPLYNKVFFLESFLQGELPSEADSMKEIETFVKNINY